MRRADRPTRGWRPPPASTLYAAARFNAWIAAMTSASGAEMEANHDEMLEYSTSQVRKMLAENLRDYAANFDRCMARE